MNTFSRRSFLRRFCGAGFTTAVGSTLLDLKLINAAAAQAGTFTDYKALVCIFCSGGNDANNLLVPRSGNDYTNYQAARGVLALTQGSLLTINPLSGAPFDLGMHASTPELQTLFENGKLAFVTNVGTLAEPLTKADYTGGVKKRPDQLFSHNDQVTQWQTSVAGQTERTGWGGRMSDLVHSVNTGSPISMSISLAGANTWEVGNSVSQYQISTDGAVSLTGVDSTRLQAVRDIMNLTRTNTFQRDYATLKTRALDNAVILSGALASIPAAQITAIDGAFTGLTSSLAAQLKMVAKVIAARNSLLVKRQIFFCQLGGFDTHSEQINTQSGLLQQVSQAVSAFYNASVATGVDQNVTAFTASDFGRTYQSNGVGSDHGWGTHQMIVGGAVQGRRLYGTYPSLTINGPDDTGLGRWIPTLSVDQYSATLAKWFGVTDAELDTILPNLNRFSTRDLGFMG